MLLSPGICLLPRPPCCDDEQTTVLFFIYWFWGQKSWLSSWLRGKPFPYWALSHLCSPLHTSSPRLWLVSFCFSRSVSWLTWSFLSSWPYMNPTWGWKLYIFMWSNRNDHIEENGLLAGTTHIYSNEKFTQLKLGLHSWRSEWDKLCFWLMGRKCLLLGKIWVFSSPREEGK